MAAQQERAAGAAGSEPRSAASSLLREIAESENLDVMCATAVGTAVPGPADDLALVAPTSAAGAVGDASDAGDVV